MGRLFLALKAFFRVLGSGALATEVARVLEGRAAPEAQSVPQPAAEPAVIERKPARSHALDLLSAMQREARFVDFLQEPLANYSDAQIGAAVRDVHRDCAALVERLFALRPLVAAAEGSPLDVPAGFDSARFRLLGNVTGQPPYTGKLCHHGWQATRCELPEWTGKAKSALIVAPAEVELK